MKIKNSSLFGVRRHDRFMLAKALFRVGTDDMEVERGSRQGAQNPYLDKYKQVKFHGKPNHSTTRKHRSSHHPSP